MSALHTTAGVGFPKETKTYDQIHAGDERYELHNDGDCEDSEHQYAEESGCEDPEDEVDDLVKEDMKKLDDSFRGISKRYRLVNRIGEGTFSTVYKAEDLLYDVYQNDWDMFRDNEPDNWASPPPKKRRLEDTYGRPLPTKRKKPRYVALKKIYVTSSPIRIQNELELLHDLRGCRSVCPLITAFRHQDQVVAVLPFFPHTDFRIQYRTFMVADMRHYFRSLFTALHSVHKHEIIHRDIKPTNFLYNPDIREGVLVDFGLAEREGSEYTGSCLCTQPANVRHSQMLSVQFSSRFRVLSSGYPKNDSRPSKRANRAGTRGFRAPEVLFKCTNQTTKIDMWSAGVILLTLLGRRFPFFNSADDVDAMIETASIFGTRRMKLAAGLHGQRFETNIPTIGEKGYSWEKLVKWASCVEELTESEKQASRLLAGLMELDPRKRLSAKEALNHEFFTDPIDHDVEWGGNPDDSGPTSEEEEGNGEDDPADEVAMV